MSSNKKRKAPCSEESEPQNKESYEDETAEESAEESTEEPKEPAEETAEPADPIAQRLFSHFLSHAEHNSMRLFLYRDALAPYLQTFRTHLSAGEHWIQCAEEFGLLTTMRGIYSLHPAGLIPLYRFSDPITLRAVHLLRSVVDTLRRHGTHESILRVVNVLLHYVPGNYTIHATRHPVFAVKYRVK